MEFERDTSGRNAGKQLGFFLGYFVFFNVFFLILNFLGKMPFQIAYLDYVLLLLIVFVFGKIVSLVVRYGKG